MISGPTSLESAAANQERLARLRSFHLTDAGNAEAFELLYGDRFRFDHSRGRWVMWNGRYWAADQTGEADRAALQTARERLRAIVAMRDNIDAEEYKRRVGWAFHSESAYARKAMLASAQSIQSLATTASDYDRDPFLITVGNGTLDLHTGSLRAFSPDDLITQTTSVSYVPDAICPRWDRFLEEVFAAKRSLISFVQRAVGYSLCGDTREQCLFILYGGGANGKSTFLEVILRLLGTYAAITSFSTFLVHQNPGTPRNDVAKLHGARLVKAAESQKQAALDEATVKEVTGGDTISARFLFKEFFDFRPQFKIWLATNHRPSIHGTDDAIWRRIKLIPFDQQFTGKQRDSKLRDKLEAELSGILAWAVRGGLEWQRQGFGSAPVVDKATLEYRRESDTIGRFLSDRCTSQSGDQAGGRELFAAYTDWCGGKVEKPESNSAFAKALEQRGIRKKRSNRGTVYLGVGLRPGPKPQKD